MCGIQCVFIRDRILKQGEGTSNKVQSGDRFVAAGITTFSTTLSCRKSSEIEAHAYSERSRYMRVAQMVLSILVSESSGAVARVATYNDATAGEIGPSVLVKLKE